MTAGTVNIRSSTALGAADGTAANGTTVTAGATLQLQGGIGVGNEALQIVGTGAAGQNGALVNVSGNNIFAGAITLAGATTIAIDAGTLALTSNAIVGTTGGANALTLLAAAQSGRATAE